MFLDIVQEIDHSVRTEITVLWDLNIRAITVDTTFSDFCDICGVDDVIRTRWDTEGARYMYLTLLWTKKAFPVGIQLGTILAYKELAKELTLKDDDITCAIETVVKFYRDVLKVMVKQSNLTMGSTSDMLFNREPSCGLCCRIYRVLAENLRLIEIEVVNFIDATMAQTTRGVYTDTGHAALVHERVKGLSRRLLPVLWDYSETIPPYECMDRRSPVGKAWSWVINNQLRTFYTALRNKDKYKSHIKTSTKKEKANA